MLRYVPIYLSVLTLFISSAFSGPTPPPYRTQINRYEGEKTGRYIVTLKEGASRAGLINHLTTVGKAAVQVVYDYGDVFNGLAAEFDPIALSLLQTLPYVESISEDGIMHTTASITQTDSPWGLARLSSTQRLETQDASLQNFNYNYDDPAGTGVDIYIVDTGIQTNHTDFRGRAQWGKTFGGYKDEDGNGHGTHVAGTAAGTKYGVAKSASIIAVKVLSDEGSGSISDIIAGLVYVALRARLSKRPSVVNMSLGGGKSFPLDIATAALVKFGGVHVVVAAGNSNEDAGNTSPAGVKEAITVGASTIGDERAFFSNYGSVVDVFAPGLNITSAWIGSNTTATRRISGTSMATPHVAGLVAYLINLGNKDISPQKMEAKLKEFALKNALTDIPAGTANLLAHNNIATQV